MVAQRSGSSLNPSTSAPRHPVNPFAPGASAEPFAHPLLGGDQVLVARLAPLCTTFKDVSADEMASFARACDGRGELNLDCSELAGSGKRGGRKYRAFSSYLSANVAIAIIF
jgi:hypothetical protein